MKLLEISCHGSNVLFFSVLPLSGGLKVWECTIDLVKYLLENHVGFKGCKVLDVCIKKCLHADRTMNMKHIKEDFNLKAWIRFFCELKHQKSFFQNMVSLNIKLEEKTV